MVTELASEGVRALEKERAVEQQRRREEIIQERANRFDNEVMEAYDA